MYASQVCNFVTYILSEINLTMEFALAIVLIILGTVGLIGNIVSILILNTHQMKSKVNFMLQGKVVHKIFFPKLHNLGLKVFIFFY